MLQPYFLFGILSVFKYPTTVMSAVAIATVSAAAAAVGAADDDDVDDDVV